MYLCQWLKSRTASYTLVGKGWVNTHMLICSARKEPFEINTLFLILRYPDSRGFCCPFPLLGFNKKAKSDDQNKLLNPPDKPLGPGYFNGIFEKKLFGGQSTKYDFVCCDPQLKSPSPPKLKTKNSDHPNHRVFRCIFFSDVLTPPITDINWPFFPTHRSIKLRQTISRQSTLYSGNTICNDNEKYKLYIKYKLKKLNNLSFFDFPRSPALLCGTAVRHTGPEIERHQSPIKYISNAIANIWAYFMPNNIFPTLENK